MKKANRALKLILVALLGACAANPFEPVPIDQVGFLDRAQTQTRGGLRVTAAVPTAEEAEALFDVPLYFKGIQPVWLEIENQNDDPFWFFSVGLDAQYFTPIETSFLNQKDEYRQSNQIMNRYFFERGMPQMVPAGETRAGYIFTSLDEGTKAFNVELSGDDSVLQRFTFFIPVPGLRIDHAQVDFGTLYQDEEIKELSEAELIETLEALPCCVTDKASEDLGDPLNLVVIGDPDDVYYSFIRAGWDETETVYGGSSIKTVTSFLFGGEYRYSPISALYLFGRGQDVAYQWTRDTIHERNHLRLWLSPYRFHGTSVWIGQISRDIGVRFTRKTITTHKIDPDVDETREYLLENLAYAQALAKIGYVGGVGAAPIDAPRGNLTGDPYFTDGYRVVLWLSSRPAAIDDIENLGWAQPN